MSLFPICCVALIAVLCALTPGGGSLAGSGAGTLTFLPVSVIFAIGLRHPGRLPSWAVFLSGLAADAASGGPLGYWPLLLLLSLAGARIAGAAPIAPSRWRDWAAFTAFAAILGSVAWLVASLYMLEALAIGPIARPLLLQVAAFPLVVWTVSSALRWTDGRRASASVGG